jgi:peptidoglycan/LPS O-acetylase OafA/YrhL
MPGDYETAARSAVYAAGSLSNIFFLNNTGYFDAASETMPFLHTWSLGVEEQFYLMWPAVLFALTRFSSKRAPLILTSAVIAICSFAWSVHLVGSNPKRAFYGADVRTWELAIGSLIALVPIGFWQQSKRLTTVAGILGMCLIVSPMFLLTKLSPFPGANALAPVIGATMILAPWSCDSPLTRMLSLPPMVLSPTRFICGTGR